MKVFVLMSILSCSAFIGIAAQIDAHQNKDERVGASNGAACSLLSPRGKKTETPDDGVLLKAYNGQVHLIRALYVTAMVTGKSGNDSDSGKRPREIPTIIYILRPDFVHVSGALSRDSSRGFEMTSDGHEFSLLVPEDGKKVFLAGPSDAPAKSKILKENVRPQPFLDALRWQEGKLRIAPAAQPIRDSDTRVVEIELPPARNGVRMAQVEFNLRDGVVNSLTAYTDTGQIIYKAQYSTWKEMKTMSEKGPGGCFPRSIHVSRPAEDYELNLQILQLNLNPDISMSTFRPSPQHGIPVTRLDGLGNPIGK